MVALLFLLLAGVATATYLLVQGKRGLLVEERGPKYLLHRGAHWPPVHHFQRIATGVTNATLRIEQLGPKYQLRSEERSHKRPARN